jgi:5,10-methylenetetrahydromethanopterin reductase
MKYGIFGGHVAGGPIAKIVRHARQAEADGFAHYFLPQIFQLDAMGALAVVGREVPRIHLGTAVVPTYSRHPMTMAQQALTVQAATDNRFILGIGLSHQIVVEAMFGLSYDKPLRHMREYLDALIPLLHERTVSVQGDVISAHFGIDIADVTAPPVLVAALGPLMLELTGRVAQGTVTWMTGAETLANYIVPTISAAATAAGRPAPRIGAALPVQITDDVAAARAYANTEFAVYNDLPSYRAMLDREGAAGPGDVALVGTVADVRGQILRLEDGGVTDFVAVEFGTADERARTRELLVSLL